MADRDDTQPAGTGYQIRVRGHLSAVGAAWFDGLTVTNEAGGDAVLSGPIRDQAALMAVLRRVHDLGLTLVAVHRMPADREGAAGEGDEPAD
jgi:hypothetical protein